MLFPVTYMGKTELSYTNIPLNQVNIKAQPSIHLLPIHLKQPQENKFGILQPILPSNIKKKKVTSGMHICLMAFTLDE